jgi:hypothetical protein
MGCLGWAGIVTMALALPAAAETVFRDIPVQYIAALAAPGDSAGGNAQDWGLWELDPGPRGVWLSLAPALMASGLAPAGWRFDARDWWLEEHGLIMEAPVFGLPPGQYLVTGGREVTAVLTVGPPDAGGAQSWALSEGTLGDVTHLGCRAANYSPREGLGCVPTEARRGSDFPVGPGAAMPPVGNCLKQDYAVLFVVGLAD